jgi:hypothetical protein
MYKGKHPKINMIKKKIAGAQLHFLLTNICMFGGFLLKDLGGGVY